MSEPGKPKGGDTGHGSMFGSGTRISLGNGEMSGPLIQTANELKKNNKYYIYHIKPRVDTIGY